MKKEKKKHVLQFRITREESDLIDVASERAGITKSEYVRWAIRWYVNLLKHAPEVLDEIEKDIERKWGKL